MNTTPDYFINNCYNEFKVFMLNPDLPIFKINYCIENTSFMAQIQNPMREGENYVLDISTTWHTLSVKERKTTLYHEFTHIFDNYTLFKNLNNQERNNNLSFYTEINATLVELMHFFGFKNINDNKTIKNGKQFDGHTMIEDVAKEVLKISNEDNILNVTHIKLILNTIGYIFGSIMFYFRYCKDGNCDYNQTLVEMNNIIKVDCYEIFNKSKEIFILNKNKLDNIYELSEYAKRIENFLNSSANNRIKNKIEENNEKIKQLNEIRELLSSLNI